MAYIDLAREQEQMPTAAEVAARAGTSLRSIFQRFPSMADVGLAAFDHVLEQPILPPPAEVLRGDRATRIAFHVGFRGSICETWIPVWRVVTQARCDEMAKRVEILRGRTRERVSLLFARELEPLGSPQRTAILIAMEAVTDFDSWGRMRKDYGLSFDEAKDVWRETIDRILPSEAGK
ncbi:MAG: TetR/AcrR family transcriptional regulator [Reyranellaceae bacterium]